MKKHYRALSDGTPYLIRGVDPDHKDRFEENASNDSLTGHVYGLYMVWKWCPSLRDRAAAMIEGLARSIIKGGFAMVNHDGKPTTYGQLIQGWKTDPLRLTLCLALLVLAHSATGSHAAVIRKLAEDYKPILMYPKVRLLWWDTKYDTHRSAIHLSILADLAVPGLHEAIFKEGLMRIWLMQRKEADPWLLSLISEQVRIYPPEMVRVVSRINEYEFEERGPILERLNSLQKDYWKAHGAVRIFEYPPKWIPGAKPKLYASQPLPFWMMHSQDFFPQRDLRSVDGWQGSTDGRLRHSGADFIGSYWRLRAQGHIKEGE
jgi:hypothetical protein